MQPHPEYRPDANGGNTLYLPVPYARHCKVTWEEAGHSARYYQINYRTYARGTRVQTFTRGLLEQARPEIERVQRGLSTPPESAPGLNFSTEAILSPGGTHGLDLPRGAHAVRRLELRVPIAELASPEHALRSLIVQMECDGEPTIWAPASDFFRAGVGLSETRNWYRTTTLEGTLICRWVMPYRKSARITLANVAELPLRVSLQATIDAGKWNRRSLHFHAVWHYESGLKTSPNRDWNFVQIKGRGVYVGDTLALFNPIATWYGEGDEKIWIDGESFPSHLGTGTEDYYGYSYAPKPVHMTPFCGQPRIDEPKTQGQNTLTRTCNLDGIPFHRSLQFDLELIAWKPTTLTYAATTYWYAAPGTTTSVRPQPREAGARIPTLSEAMAATAAAATNAFRRLGAFECEKMKLVANPQELRVVPQDMEGFEGLWSNHLQLHGVGTGVGDFIEIEWTAKDATARRLLLYATQAPDYGRLRFHLNGSLVARTLHGYATTVKIAPVFDLGIAKPRDGKFTLRVEIEGTNPASIGSKYLFGLDCLVAENP